MALKVLIVANFSDLRCGFRNFADQTVTALSRHPRIEVTKWDGTYPVIYAAREAQRPTFFPADVASYDVVHLIWNAMTMNHYSGAPWAELQASGVLTSWWDGGPSDASCPFIEWLQVRWSDYPREGYEYCPYPVPDWIDDLPKAPERFTVGTSSVRGDGVAEVRQVCEAHGWDLNLPTPGAWLSVEDEVRRLARSSVNVCWYNTSPIWHNRASAPSMMIAARRPLLINQDPLVAHLWAYPDIYHGDTWKCPPCQDMNACLEALSRATLPRMVPQEAFHDMRWAKCAERFVSVWEERSTENSTATPVLP